MLQNGIVWIAYWKWDDPEAGCHTDTCFRTHSSVIPLRPLAGSSLHRFRQSLSTAHQPTWHCRITGSAQHQPSWNSITTWPARVSSPRKTTSSVTPLICLGFSGFSWVSLWPVNFANFRNSAHPSRSVSVPPKAQKASWHTKICLMILLIAEIWQNPCWAWSIWSWIASFYRVVYISGRSGVQETINSNYLAIRTFKRHLPQSTDVAGQLRPSASGDLKTKNKNLTTRQGRWRNMTLLRKRSLYIK